LHRAGLKPPPLNFVVAMPPVDAQVEQPIAVIHRLSREPPPWQSNLQLISSRLNSLQVLPSMRFILGFLSGVIGLLAGWFGLAALVIGLSGPDRDGGVAMGAFFNIAPIGGVVGFVAGVLLFIKIGLVSQGTSSPNAERSDAAPAPTRTRVSPTFAVVVLALAEASLGGPGTN
jgi:hypothetical protein